MDIFLVIVIVALVSIILAFVHALKCSRRETENWVMTAHEWKACATAQGNRIQKLNAENEKLQEELAKAQDNLQLYMERDTS